MHGDEAIDGVVAKHESIGVEFHESRMVHAPWRGVTGSRCGQPEGVRMDIDHCSRQIEEPSRRYARQNGVRVIMPVLC